MVALAGQDRPADSSDARMTSPLEHVAGPYIAGRQDCARCGARLLDNRESIGADGRPAGHWQEGTRVIRHGCYAWAADPGVARELRCEPRATA